MVGKAVGLVCRDPGGTGDLDPSLSVTPFAGSGHDTIRQNEAGIGKMQHL